MSKETEKIDYTKIRDHRIRGKICNLMSEMLDNPDKCGIYPTSKFMWKMETFILSERLDAVTKLTEKILEIGKFYNE